MLKQEIQLFHKYKTGTIAIVPFRVEKPLLPLLKGWRVWYDEFGNTLIHNIKEVITFMDNFKRESKIENIGNLKVSSYNIYVKEIKFTDSSGVIIDLKAFYNSKGWFKSIRIEGFNYKILKK